MWGEKLRDKILMSHSFFFVCGFLITFSILFSLNYGCLRVMIGDKLINYFWARFVCAFMYSLSFCVYFCVRVFFSSFLLFISFERCRWFQSIQQTTIICRYFFLLLHFTIIIYTFFSSLHFNSSLRCEK